MVIYFCNLLLQKLIKNMRNLIIIGHPNIESFCYNGIFKTINEELSKNNEEIEIIDLYRDDFTRPRTNLIKKYQDLVTWSERMYFISPVWWFRLTPRMEMSQELHR